MYGISALGLAVLPIVTNWVSEIVKNVWLGGVGSISGDAILALVLLVLIILAAIWMFVRLSSALLRVHIRSVAVTPHAALITLMSDQSNLTLDESTSRWQYNNQEMPAGLDDICDSRRIIPGLKWQQNLRAARHHRAVLKWICLVGSGGPKGSAKDLAVAAKLFQTYFPGTIIVTTLTDGAPDFENLEETRNALLKVIDDCPYEEKDIVIDITGGQKTASVAAALVTLDRRDLVFQYVGTGDRSDTIFGFNAQTLGQDGR